MAWKIAWCMAAFLLTASLLAQGREPRFQVYAEFTNAPKQRLAVAPGILSGDGPVTLINFDDEGRREAARRAAAEQQVAGGVQRGMLEMVGPCLLDPRSCAGYIAFGAVAGGIVGGVLPIHARVSAKDAAQLGAVCRVGASTETLVSAAARAAPAPDAPANSPRLRVQLAAVVLDPQPRGVGFRVVAAAQAEGSEWPPSMHYVHVPPRSVKGWLNNDGRLLKQDLYLAVQALGANIAASYAPALAETSLKAQP